MNAQRRQSTGSEATANATGAQRHHVHNSYIWLGGIRATGAVVIVALLSSISGLVQLAESMARNGFFEGEALTILIVIGVALLVLLLIGALVVGLHAWAWRHLWYEVGPEEVSVYSGIINKKRVHVPYDRIQTVDQKASLLQRIFGVCNVSIDTAGGASNKAVLIPYLRKGDAEALRREIYARKMSAAQAAVGSSAASSSAASSSNAAYPPPANAPVYGAPQPGARFGTIPQPANAMSAGAPVASSASQQGNVLDVGDEVWQQLGGVFAGDAVDMGAPSFEYRLSNKELVFTGLSGSSGFAAAVLIFVCVVMQVVGFAFDLFPDESNTLISSTYETLDQAFLIAIGAGAVIVGAIVVWALSVLATCIQYGGFRACRRGSRIEVERGLLQHQTESLDIGRVQSVIIKQSFIRRLIGYCELSFGKVDANQAGDDGNQQSTTTSGLIVHPFLKIDRVQEILAGLAPEFADIPKAETRLAPVALRRGLTRRCLWQGSGFWTAVCVAILQASMNLAGRFDADIMYALPYIDMVCIVLYILAAILLVIDAVGAVLWYRESSFATNRRFARVKNGGLSSVDVSMPRQKIQFGGTKTNPLQRMAGTATIRMRTAAGIGGTTTQLIDVRVDDADRWLAWIEPRSVK